MRLTKNLQLREFNSKDGIPVPTEFIGNVKKIAEAVQKVADELGADKIIVTSGWRSPLHNNIVGGVPNSRHLTGEAADVQLFTQGIQIDPKLVSTQAWNYHELGVGTYKTFTHLDIGPKRQWGEKVHEVESETFIEWIINIIRQWIR